MNVSRAFYWVEFSWLAVAVAMVGRTPPWDGRFLKPEAEVSTLRFQKALNGRAYPGRW